jgi:hypothetical protein
MKRLLITLSIISSFTLLRAEEINILGQKIDLEIPTIIPDVEKNWQEVRGATIDYLKKQPQNATSEQDALEKTLNLEYALIEKTKKEMYSLAEESNRSPEDVYSVFRGLNGHKVDPRLQTQFDIQNGLYQINNALYTKLNLQNIPSTPPPNQKNTNPLKITPTKAPNPIETQAPLNTPSKPRSYEW